MIAYTTRLNGVCYVSLFDSFEQAMIWYVESRLAGGRQEVIGCQIAVNQTTINLKCI